MQVVPAVLLHPWQIVIVQCWHVLCLTRKQPAKLSKADGPRRAGWAFKNAEQRDLSCCARLAGWLAQPVLALFYYFYFFVLLRHGDILVYEFFLRQSF